MSTMCVINCIYVAHGKMCMIYSQLRIECSNLNANCYMYYKTLHTNVDLKWRILNICFPILAFVSWIKTFLLHVSITNDVKLNVHNLLYGMEDGDDEVKMNVFSVTHTNCWIV